VPHCDTAQIAATQLPAFPTAPNGTQIVPTCQFAPPYNDEYLMWPCNGSGGCVGWPRMSYSPLTNELYVCAHLESTAVETVSTTSPQTTAINVGVDAAGSNTPGEGGTVSAIRLDNNSMAWQVQYMQSPDGDCYSGTLSTAGGLLFTASRGDGSIPNVESLPAGAPPFGGFIYAYDAKTGKELWKWQAPDYIQSPPVTYSVSGKQYVAELVMNTIASGQRQELTVFSLNH